MSEARLKGVWNQHDVPVVLKRDGKGEKLRVRVPSRFPDEERNWAEAYRWLRNSRRHIPRWVHDGQYWELPQSWLNDFVNRSLIKHKRVYIIQRHNDQEKCAPACMNAEGHDCECSCMGANHGARNDGSWFEVSETFATRRNGRELACRLLTFNGSVVARLKRDPARVSLTQSRRATTARAMECHDAEEGLFR